MEVQEGKELIIIDPLSNTTYTFTLDEVEYQRAQEDMYFASELLQRAKTDNLNEENAAGPSSENQKNVWHYNKTLCLIKSMKNHYEDLKHPRKRRHVYENIANDLLSAGFHAHGNSCQIKWKSLVRSYTTAKDLKIKTGRGPSRFHFFDEMDAILGTMPSHNCNHSLDSSTDENTNDIENVVDTRTEDTETIDTDVDAFTENEKNENINCTNTTQKDTPLEAENKQGKKRMRTNYEGYLLEKRRFEEQKNKRHDERMQIERMKLDVEKAKLNLLKKYLNDKNEQ